MQGPRPGQRENQENLGQPGPLRWLSKKSGEFLQQSDNSEDGEDGDKTPNGERTPDAERTPKPRPGSGTIPRGEELAAAIEHAKQRWEEEERKEKDQKGQIGSDKGIMNLSSNDINEAIQHQRKNIGDECMKELISILDENGENRVKAWRNL